MTGFTTEQAAQYWKDSGPFVAGPGAGSPEHVVAEQVLSELLSELDGVESVLDVGCGRGRLAFLLKDVLPKASYSGLDIGSAQIAATKLVRPDGTFYESRIQDFDTKRKWDLVLCSEMLMHIPPADIQPACDKIKGLARKWVVTIDWTAPVDGPIAPENWRYDYPALFGSVERIIPTGLQSIFVIRP